MSKRIFQVKRNITLEGEKPDETQTTLPLRGLTLAVITALIIGLATTSFLIAFYLTA